jgi:hypothetical protein
MFQRICMMVCFLFAYLLAVGAGLAGFVMLAVAGDGMLLVFSFMSLIAAGIMSIACAVMEV